MTRELLMVNTRKLTKNADGVEPGEIFPLTTCPAKKVRPCLLRIPERCAAHFEIVDVLVDKRSQNPAAQSIPAARFSALHDGGAWVLEDVSDVRPLVMLLRNTSEKPIHFEGAWDCDDGPQPEMTYLVHDLGNQLCMPGVRAQITSRPQRSAIRPRDLWIPPALAAHFTISDVLVGNRSQFPQSHGGVPAAKFSHGAGAAFSCETIQTAMDHVIIVTNTSDEPRAFVAVWGCDVAPESVRPRLAMSDLDVERIADAVARKMTTRSIQDDLAEQNERLFKRTREMREVQGLVPGRPYYATADGGLAPTGSGAPIGVARDATTLNVGMSSPFTPFSDRYLTAAHAALGDEKLLDSTFHQGLLDKAHANDRMRFPTAVTPLSTVGTEPGKREPIPTRAERKDPPSFGWDPFGSD